MTTGEIIKQLRKEKKMTQEELANYIGVQKSAVAKWETGRTQNIKTETLHALAILFGVQPAYLLDGKGERLMLNADEIELIKNFRRAPESVRNIISALLQEIAL